MKYTPYHTFKNMAKIVKEEQYDLSKLTYDQNGLVIAFKKLLITEEKTSIIAKEFRTIPDF